MIVAIGFVDTSVDGVDTSVDNFVDDVDTSVDGVDTFVDGVDVLVDGVDDRVDGVDRSRASRRALISSNCDRRSTAITAGSTSLKPRYCPIATFTSALLDSFVDATNLSRRSTQSAGIFVETSCCITMVDTVDDRYITIMPCVTYYRS